MRGSVTSLTYCPRPCVSRARFGRGTARPMYEFGRSRAVSSEGRSGVIFMGAPLSLPRLRGREAWGRAPRVLAVELAPSLVPPRLRGGWPSEARSGGVHLHGCALE